jgi:hypothetical protein
MGDFALIESYLDTLRQAVAWRPDSDEVIAELADHLQVSVEREMAVGVDPIDAQRLSLQRFGEPRLVSRAFASTHAGGVALPTEKTRRYGLLEMIGALAMLAFFIVLLVETVPMLERSGMTGSDAGWYWFVLSFAGFAGIPLLILGIKERHGGTMGRWAWVAVGLGVAGAVVMIAPWMVPVGALLSGSAALITGAHMLGEGRSPRMPTVLFSSGLLIAVAFWVGMEQVGGGVRDYWGDAVLPRVIAYAAVILLFIPGYFILGRWLNAETAADEAQPPLVAS